MFAYMFGVILYCHNPYFNRWFSAICFARPIAVYDYEGHNPYFNRWFSAIIIVINWNANRQSHNPYFNRWFSAIYRQKVISKEDKSHNPYFNRWFSAILKTEDFINGVNTVTILILIDGFLQ